MIMKWAQNLFKNDGAYLYKGFERYAYDNLKKISENEVLKFCQRVGLSDKHTTHIVGLHKIANKKSIDEFLEFLKSSDEDAFPFELSYNPTFKEEQAKQMQLFSDTVAGKRVALVGPAAYTETSGQGQHIENFDMVARLNFGWPVKEKLQPDIGKRVDLLYHCCNGDYPLQSLYTDEMDKIQFVCMEHQIMSLSLKKECAERKIPTVYTIDIMKQLSEKINSWPSTGLTAISHLLSCPIKELFVFGLTFWKSPYSKNYQGGGASSREASELTYKHLKKNEVRHIEYLLKKDIRLKVDQCASEIMFN